MFVQVQVAEVSRRASRCVCCRHFPQRGVVGSAAYCSQCAWSFSAASDQRSHPRWWFLWSRWVLRSFCTNRNWFFRLWGSAKKDLIDLFPSGHSMCKSVAWQRAIWNFRLRCHPYYQICSCETRCVLLIQPHGVRCDGVYAFTRDLTLLPYCWICSRLWMMPVLGTDLLFHII